MGDYCEWIATRNYGVTFLMHYLDDFHALGPPGSSVCQHNLDRFIDCFQFPSLACVSTPTSTGMTVLDIELDSENLQVRLPKDAFDRITALLEAWLHKRFCKRKDLESLIGHLQHACKVVPQGRSFLRRMINLLCVFRRDEPPHSSQSGSSFLTYTGGQSSSNPGVAAVSFSINNGLLCQTSMAHLTNVPHH